MEDTTTPPTVSYRLHAAEDGTWLIVEQPVQLMVRLEAVLMSPFMARLVDRLRTALLTQKEQP